jgi:hypothetical protein
MPVLTPARIAETKSAFAPIVAPVLKPIVRVAHRRVRVPAWAVMAVVLMAALSGFAAGRKRAAHRYVPYFGNLVLDTNTGKACYMVAPRHADRDGVQDASYPIDGTVNRTDLEPDSGPRIPVCGQE